MTDEKIDYLALDKDDPFLPRRITSPAPKPAPTRRPGRRAPKRERYNPDIYKWETP